MRSIIFISAVCLQLFWCNGLPNARGVGAYSYSDSAGNRYGGTYGLNDGQVVDVKGDFPPNFHPQNFQDLDDFFPSYFANLDNVLQEFPPYNGFGQYGGFPEFPFHRFGIPNNMNENSAYAGAFARPGYSRQIAAINPNNPNMPNVDQENRYSESKSGKNPGSNYMSVSSSSYSTSSDTNGQLKSSRGAETIVDDNGRITRYKVQS
uniref:Seroin transcript 2B n=1 Tax=Acanthobrahmaea europaea TaxID=119239 RepID=A0A455LAN8_9NEOP|nr:seroin transcript 2B [Acanthobrahmaea europaea]